MIELTTPPTVQPVYDVEYARAAAPSQTERLKIRDIIGEPIVNYGVFGGRELETRA